MKNRPILTEEEDKQRDKFFTAIADEKIQKILPALKNFHNFHAVDEYYGDDFMHEICQNMSDIIKVDRMHPKLKLWQEIQFLITEHTLSVDTLNNNKETSLSLLYDELEYKEEAKPYFEFLCSQSKDIDTRFNDYDFTLLYNAFEKEDISLTRMLLEKGANLFLPISGYGDKFACTHFLSKYSGDEEQQALLLNILQDPHFTPEFLLHLVEQVSNNDKLKKDVNVIASNHPEIFSSILQTDNKNNPEITKKLKESLEEIVENDLPLLCDIFIQHNIPPGEGLLWSLAHKKKSDPNSQKVTSYYDKIFTLAARTGVLTPGLANEYDEYHYIALMAEHGNGPDVAYSFYDKQTTLLHQFLKEMHAHKGSKTDDKNLFLDTIKSVPNINWNQQDEDGNRICDLVLASGDKDLIEAAGVFELVFGDTHSEARFRYHTKEELDVFHFEHKTNESINNLIANKNPGSEEKKIVQGLITIAAQCGNISFLKKVNKTKAYSSLLEGNDRVARLINSDIAELMEDISANMSHDLQNDPKEILPLSYDEMQLTLAAWKQKKDIPNTYYIGKLDKFEKYLEKQKAQPSDTPEIVALENKGHAITLVFYPNKEKPGQPTMLFIDSFGCDEKDDYPFFSENLISLAGENFPNAALKEAYDSRQTSDSTCRIRTLNDMRYIAKNLTVEALEEHINDPENSKQKRMTNNGSTVEVISLPLGLMRDSYNLYINKPSDIALTHRMKKDAEVPLNKRKETMQVFLSRVLSKESARNHYLDTKLENMQRDVIEFLLNVEEEVQASMPQTKQGEAKHTQKVLQEKKQEKVEEVLEKYKKDVSLEGNLSHSKKVTNTNRNSSQGQEL